MEAEVEVSTRRGMPTPLKQDIQSRRQSYGSSPAAAAMQAVQQEVEEEEEPEVVVRWGMPTPLKRAIQSRRQSYSAPVVAAAAEPVYYVDPQDDFEAQRGLGVTPAAPRTRPAAGRKGATGVMPTPMRAAINARRISVGPAATPAMEAAAGTCVRACVCFVVL